MLRAKVEAGISAKVHQKMLSELLFKTTFSTP
jgi:hypothetical protein